MPDKEPNGWNVWAKHVLSEMTRLDENDKELADKQEEIKDMIGALGNEMRAIVATNEKTRNAEWLNFMEDYTTFKTTMRYRASMFGALSGAIPAIIGVIMMMMKFS